MTKLLFFDTETTGIPVGAISNPSEYDKYPRLVQLAFLLINQSQFILNACNFIIKPLDFIIPNKSTLIHGITTDFALKKGHSINFVLAEFISAAIQADYIIAHNFDFDYNVIGAEAARAGFQRQYNAAFQYKENICTMRSTADLLKIPRGINGNYRNPKLSDLYFHLFGNGFKHGRNAFTDVQACAKCFFKLKEQGFYYVYQESYA
jgi:DNA polymerase-3 subunit epsilon